VERWEEKRDGNHSPLKYNIIQDSEGNEENEYPVPDSKKIKMNYVQDPNEDHKKHSERRNPATSL
jgi:hypothetical protein